MLLLNVLGVLISDLVQRMMALYVASHYKNSPNDLQLMADAPAHHLFVLLGIDEFINQFLYHYDYYGCINSSSNRSC